MSRFSFLAATLFILAAGISFAGDQDFLLVNETGVEIHNLYVSASASDDWQEDVLGVDTLEDGASATIRFPREEDECKWDFMVKDESGNGVEWGNIDLCEYGEITLHMEGSKVWATFE